MLYEIQYEMPSPGVHPCNAVAGDERAYSFALIVCTHPGAVFVETEFCHVYR